MFSRSTGKRKGGKGAPILFALLFVHCFGVFGFLFYQMFGMMAESLYATPYDWYYFAMVGLFSFALSFFFTAFTAKSELFEAKDNELLLSMPIKPRLIITSRMATLLLMEYVFALLVLNYVVWCKVSSDLFPVFAIFLCITAGDLEEAEQMESEEDVPKVMV